MADRSPGLFDVDARLAEISAKGDGLERIAALVDFEVFRPTLELAVPRRDRSRGGRPPFDHVLMLKVLILHAMHSLSDERTEFLIRDRLSSSLFLGLGLADPVPLAQIQCAVAACRISYRGHLARHEDSDSGFVFMSSFMFCSQ